MFLLFMIPILRSKSLFAALDASLAVMISIRSGRCLRLSEEKYSRRCLICDAVRDFIVLDDNLEFCDLCKVVFKR